MNFVTEFGPDPTLAQWYQARRSDGCKSARQILAALETLEDLTERFLEDHPEGCACDYCTYTDGEHGIPTPPLGERARECIRNLNYTAGLFVAAFRCDCRVSN